MKSIKVELPDKLARELNAMVKAGCFNDEAEAMRSALREFVRRIGLSYWSDFSVKILPGR
jgi:Arc/MetJ-type ribon-helix-helix transcriptional regulator